MLITCLRYYPKPQCSAISVSPFRGPHKVLIYNHVAGTVQYEIRPPDDCGRALGLSKDGKLLATGYWNRKGVDIWQLTRGRVIATFGPSQVSRVIFERTASKLLVQSEHGTAIYDTKAPHDSMRVLNADDIERGCFIRGKNQMLLPSRRRGILLKVDFKALSVTEVAVPIRKTITWIEHSPSRNALFTIDSAGNIWCFDSSLKHHHWTTTIPNITRGSGIHVGAFSGNGTLIGLTLSHHDGYDTVVLDANTGAELHRIPGISCDGYPYGDECVLLESGEILNLRSRAASNAIRKRAIKP